ncbi:hypothetical protein [Streptomyces sp. UNOB3_S3]|uniref:hypothetical protein n=1 Tax=Streptomyces sp. UNOB3_S3 TaxID=2871682 RepID=UPI001E61AABC|nr:hypothetical protein [Streptomyces sp. UNOB3_S3]MCC3778299.1 hypothetical protein [Streptomyces sp. UNOB3_S3]
MGEGGHNPPTDPHAQADPVKVLLTRHHRLCAGSVDPLEIAAGLEARGICDRVASTDYRHRDVFSLAEELHARVERTETDVACARPPTEGKRQTACAALRGARGATVTLACLWLIAHALVGDQLLTALLHGHRALAGRTGPAPAVLAGAAPTALALACAAAPAAWCAHWFAARARRALPASRDLADFGRRTRPALLVAVTVFLGALLAFLWPARSALPAGQAPGATPPVLHYLTAAALGLLLFLAGLLVAHGLPRAAVAATLAAAAAQALPPLTLLAARLPGCEALRWPVGWAAGAFGPTALSLAACVPPALALLVHAVPALSRASVHGPR